MNVDSVILTYGSHETREVGMCAMEAVAWLAGEPHSDAPACACPVIARAVIRLNDRIRDDATRTALLRPLLAEIINSRTTDRDVMCRRALVAADMAVRVFAPMALDAKGFPGEAAKLRALPEIVDRASALAGRDAANAAAYATNAAYAAYAAANANAAADAANAAAYAATAAAYATNAAADAAADAANAAAYAASNQLAAKMIRKMLAVKGG